MGVRRAPDEAGWRNRRSDGAAMSRRPSSRLPRADRTQPGSALRIAGRAHLEGERAGPRGPVRRSHGHGALVVRVHGQGPDRGEPHGRPDDVPDPEPRRKCPGWQGPPVDAVDRRRQPGRRRGRGGDEPSRSGGQDGWLRPRRRLPKVGTGVRRPRPPVGRRPRHEGQRRAVGWAAGATLGRAIEQREGDQARRHLADPDDEQARPERRRRVEGHRHPQAAVSRGPHRGRARTFRGTRVNRDVPASPAQHRPQETQRIIGGEPPPSDGAPRGRLGRRHGYPEDVGRRPGRRRDSRGLSARGGGRRGGGDASPDSRGRRGRRGCRTAPRLRDGDPDERDAQDKKECRRPAASRVAGDPVALGGRMVMRRRSGVRGRGLVSLQHPRGRRRRREVE